MKNLKSPRHLFNHLLKNNLLRVGCGGNRASRWIKAPADWPAKKRPEQGKEGSRATDGASSPSSTKELGKELGSRETSSRTPGKKTPGEKWTESGHQGTHRAERIRKRPPWGWPEAQCRGFKDIDRFWIVSC